MPARLALLCCVACIPSVAIGQVEVRETDAKPGEIRWAFLPTDRELNQKGESVRTSVTSGLAEGATGPIDVKKLMRPRFHFEAEWEPETGGVAIGSYDLSVQIPTYPIFGPPPPLVTSGYSLTQIDAPASMDLPSSLHDFALGLVWMRRINDRWTGRITVSGAFASDLDNTSSDAWQLRGGGFALFRPNERWSFAFGALVTGRDDIPVIPAAGAIWEPSRDLRIDLMMPNPRISFLLVDCGERQHWGYVGFGMSGGTWAYDSAIRGNRLTYREWRTVLGWESMPPRPPGSFGSMGTAISAEVGYVFGRKIEFDSGTPDLLLSDALLLRFGLRF